MVHGADKIEASGTPAAAASPAHLQGQGDRLPEPSRHPLLLAAAGGAPGKYGQSQGKQLVLLLPISSGQILFLTPEQLVIPEILSLGPAARLAGSWPPSLQICSPSSVPLLPSFSSAPPLSCMSHLSFKCAGVTSAQSPFLTRAFSGQKRALIFHLGISLRACISVASVTHLFVLTKTLKGLHPFFLFKSWAVSLSTRTEEGPRDTCRAVLAVYRRGSERVGVCLSHQCQEEVGWWKLS